jgi:hypothetical protein
VDFHVSRSEVLRVGSDDKPKIIRNHIFTGQRANDFSRCITFTLWLSHFGKPKPQLTGKIGKPNLVLIRVLGGIRFTNKRTLTLYFPRPFSFRGWI